MLILRRKSGESIIIGDNIKVTVLDINEGGERLAIDAPKAIPILRNELLLAADANRDSAAVAERSPSRDLLQRLGAGAKAAPNSFGGFRKNRRRTPGATPETAPESVPLTASQTPESAPSSSETPESIPPTAP